MSTQPSTVGDAIRTFRTSQEWSLDELADRVKKLTRKRPSTAKLSRIETNKQPVPVDLVGPLSEITEIPKSELRPDLAKIFEGD
jgi:transcriptional regulator with XRE-family HTH domain